MPSTPEPSPTAGALVISLDFELNWGVRDSKNRNGSYNRNLLGARDAIPGMLKLFQRYKISATWATVGFLFARSRDELEHYWPTVRPRYSDPRLDPYRQEIGKDEASDPLHFGASLLGAICATPRQEIGSQTFSHFYCLAAGQAPNEFAADLESAVCIARERGVQLRSLVMPRNEWNPEYAGIVRSAGFSAYRGNQPGWMHRATHTPSPGLRAARLLDAYRPISGTGTFGWQEIREDTGLCNIRASAFLRPCQPFLTPVRRHKIRRIQEGMSAAARTRSLYHLWWHPHNFGRHPRASLELLEDLLAHFTTLRRQYGFQSMSMREVAAAWGGGNGPVPPPRDPEPAAEGRLPGD